MSVVDPGEITARLLELRGGSDDARERLFASVYEQLKSLARRQLKLGGRTPTLGATALVHEAYLRLVDQTRTDWNDEARIALEALHEKQVAARGPSDEEAVWTSAELGRALKAQIELASPTPRAAPARPATGADPERIDLFAQHLMTIQPKDLQDPKRALALAERAVAMTNRTRWSYLRTLGDAYEETGRPDLAIDVMKEALALPDGMRSWSTVEEVVDDLRDEKRDAEIEPFLLAHRDRQLAAPHPDERMVAKTERLLALHLVKSGRAQDANPYFAQAEGRLRRVVPAGNWEIGRLLSDWGACRTELKEYPEAERLLLDGYEIVSADRDMRKATAATKERLVKLYEAWGKPDEAARWK